MEAGDAPKGSVSQHLLAGLETGVVAALAMLVWLGVSELWYRKTFWNTPNLLAATFYGESALRNRFTVHTFSGLALFFLIYGSLGMLFGLVMQDRRRSLRLTCIGILSALAWYYLVFGWAGKNWDPLLVLYTNDRPMFAGHVLYGMLLGRYSRNLLRLRQEKTEAALDASAPPLADPFSASSDLEVKD